MILNLGSRDDGDVIIHKYLIIILMTLEFGYSESVITCHMPLYYIIIWSYNPIILHE
jgi:hypothetical protein